MSNLVLIPENLLALSQAHILADSEVSASMAADNVLTEEPSEFWRTTGNGPNKTSALYGIGDGFLAVKAGGLALIGHNFYRGTQARVVLINGGIDTNFLDRVPTAIEASTNRTGAVTTIDEGHNPGGDFMTPTTGSDWDVRLSFQDPASNPIAGASRQAFWAYIKLETAPPVGQVATTVKCELYESGVLKADLGTKVLNSAAVVGYCWSWNASLLSTASGADVECKLTFVGTGSATYAPKLDSLVWKYEDSDDVTGATYDTGWVTYTPFTGSGITFLPEVAGSGSAWFIPFGANYTFQRAYVMLRVDHAPADWDPVEESPPAQPGYVQIGCAILGETWSPASDRDFGQLVSTKDYSSKSRTYGGQRFGARRFVQRILSLPMNWLTPAEAHTLFDRILWRHGILKPILVSILPGDSTEETHTTFLASLRNPENGMAATTTRVKSRAMTIEFEEEL